MERASILPLDAFAGGLGVMAARALPGGGVEGAAALPRLTFSAGAVVVALEAAPGKGIGGMGASPAAGVGGPRTGDWLVAGGGAGPASMTAGRIKGAAQKRLAVVIDEPDTHFVRRFVVKFDLCSNTQGHEKTRATPNANGRTIL